VTDTSGWRKGFVRGVWATHNNSRSIRAAIEEVLEELRTDDLGLNVGCGETELHPQVLGVDLRPGGCTSCIADGLNLPFKADAFQLVLSQEFVEHVSNPTRAVEEMARVLTPGGVLYLQVPFVIGYHPGPDDYWRFSHMGIRQLVEQAGLACERVDVAVGAGTGFYRILVEFVAGVFERIHHSLYIPSKAGAAFLFYPFKWLDGWLDGGRARNRIPGGHFAIGRKQEG
jgi:SAM-dependent methyltransferase